MTIAPYRAMTLRAGTKRARGRAFSVLALLAVVACTDGSEQAPSDGETGGAGGGRLPNRGPYDDKGVSAPPQDCKFHPAGTCCTYQFCLDASDTAKVFEEGGAGGANAAPPDIADVCQAPADTSVGFCGEISTLPTVQDGKCCFAVYAGDCC